MDDHPVKETEQAIQKRAEGRRKSDLLAGQPFKAGSLADEPQFKQSPAARAMNDEMVARARREEVARAHWRAPHSPGTGYNPGTFVEAVKNDQEAVRAIARRPTLSSSSSKRVSLNTAPQTASRPASTSNDTAIASSASSSPRPAPLPRFQSSFAGRTQRPLSITSTTDRSGGSGGSSTEPKNDEDHLDGIKDFISFLEGTAKDAPFTQKPAQPHSIDLAQYSAMREPSSALANDMASSSLLQASNTPPSRRLSNVPPLSTSSSPSRAAFAAVRSRLSTNSIKEEEPEPKEEGAEEEEEAPFLFHQDL